MKKIAEHQGEEAETVHWLVRRAILEDIALVKRKQRRRDRERLELQFKEVPLPTASNHT